MEEKKCGTCKEIKLLSEFDNSGRTKDGKRNRCKQCRVIENVGHPERSGGTHSSYYKKFPAPQKGIYGLIDPDKNVVYIGESKYISARVYTHLSINKGALENHLDDLTGYNYIILWDGSEDTKSNRLAIEAMLIHALKPKYNKQWNQED